MIIRCETNNDYNRFYLPDITTMEELKKFADKNIPIKCYMLGGRYKYRIYLIDDMRLVHLYLNNYLQYYEIRGYIFDEKELDELDKNICSNCKHNKEGCSFTCEYEEVDSGCKNYQEKQMSKFKKFISKLIKKIKYLFQREFWLKVFLFDS
jgi:hypothetical protein